MLRADASRAVSWTSPAVTRAFEWLIQRLNASKRLSGIRIHARSWARRLVRTVIDHPKHVAKAAQSSDFYTAAWDFLADAMNINFDRARVGVLVEPENGCRKRVLGDDRTRTK